MTPRLAYRQTSTDGFRVSADGVEIGSVSRQHDHVHHGRTYWSWGVDTMPLMSHGGRPPSGEAETFEAALAAFKTAFVKWHGVLPAEQWMRTIEYIDHCAKRHLRRRSGRALAYCAGRDPFENPPHPEQGRPEQNSYRKVERKTGSKGREVLRVKFIDAGFEIRMGRREVIASKIGRITQVNIAPHRAGYPWPINRHGLRH